MLQLTSYRAHPDEKHLGATAEDFEQLFARQNTELLMLSLHLTTDAEKAETCLILAMRDCVFGSCVSKDRLHTWARRMVMRNAIRLVCGAPNDVLGESGIEFYLQPNDFQNDALRESLAIFTLPDLDRLAFVICVLERYSILDCALLLRKAPQEVYDAIVRAIAQMLAFEQRRDLDANARFPRIQSAAFWPEGSQLEDSCGSILH